ncbi:hypothetical protein B0H10DRAFT_1817812 [Mycena sp. CBHHK59/15]|nr:hypothetical protein B0H10DRAFT_1817812 [Mycena sp. CBHHK59/15]
MQQILEERGLFHAGLLAQCSGFKCEADATSCCCRRILFNQPDIINQKSALQELVESRGHICDFYPKYHCELSLGLFLLCHYRSMDPASMFHSSSARFPTPNHNRRHSPEQGLGDTVSVVTVVDLTSPTRRPPGCGLSRNCYPITRLMI